MFLAVCMSLALGVAGHVPAPFLISFLPSRGVPIVGDMVDSVTKVGSELEVAQGFIVDEAHEPNRERTHIESGEGFRMIGRFRLYKEACELLELCFVRKDRTAFERPADALNDRISSPMIGDVKSEYVGSRSAFGFVEGNVGYTQHNAFIGDVSLVSRLCGFRTGVGGICRSSSLTERKEYQADTKYSDRHPDDGGNAHKPGPSGRNQLGLKIIFVVSALASGLVFLAYALYLGLRGERHAASFGAYIGAVCVTLGACLGLLLVG